MSDQVPSTVTHPSEPPLPQVKLWKASTIGLIAFLCGFPGGIVVASINWIRMGLKNKAILHLMGEAFTGIPSRIRERECIYG